ncbi:MAG: aldehyde dehydrogenase family protein, partial [Lewinellaceae bacterium]|nr:aldehyde dehydrogenase family protein [Lewinellaceae bacterium]
AKHLASVTLELGGKSPAVVDHTVNLNLEAEKCVWAKHLNNGQTCIAPDYLLVEESAKDAFVEGYQKAIDKLYNREGKGVQASPDLCRIISDRHVKRLSGLLEDALAKGATVLAGGQVDEADRFIAPTLLGNVTDDMRIMQEEIFGPIMPLATFTNPEEVVAAIRRRPKPLTMYIGSHRKDFVNYLLSNTSAGGTIINDYLLGFSNPNLPFGGVNNSGIGKSMGLHGFREFSNERGIVRRFLGDLRVIFPPFTKAKMRIVNILTYYLS